MLAVFWKRREIADFGKIAGPERGKLEAVISDLDLSLRSAGVAISLVLMLVVALGAAKTGKIFGDIWERVFGGF